MLRRNLMLTAAGTLAMPAVLRAQGAWPDRPVRIVVPYPPGGSTDAVARVLQSPLSEALGRPIVIENKGGGNGSLGAGEVARAQADGYTWLLAYDNQATNESITKLPFKTMTDFTPTTLVATGPLALVANAQTPFKVWADIVAEAKAKPDSLSYATSGIGGLAHVATVRLSNEVGIRLTHVPYRGGGPALQDALAGHVPLFTSNVVIIKQHILAGRLVPIGVTTAKESRHVPGVKSFAELGVAGFEALTWWALMGPKGVPDPIVNKMHATIAKVVADPSVRDKLEDQGSDVVASSPEETGRFLADQVERWGKVIRENGITADT